MKWIFLALCPNYSAAISGAVQRPRARFAPIKTEEQMDRQAPYRVRGQVLLSECGFLAFDPDSHIPIRPVSQDLEVCSLSACPAAKRRNLTKTVCNSSELPDKRRTSMGCGGCLIEVDPSRLIRCRDDPLQCLGSLLSKLAENSARTYPE